MLLRSTTTLLLLAALCAAASGRPLAATDGVITDTSALPVAAAAAAAPADPAVAVAEVAAAAAVAPAADGPTVAARTVTDQSVFPTARPPMWNFRTTAGVTYSCKKIPGTAGWTLSVSHAVIPGVDSAMMAWMFRNMATASAVSPLDGKAYPLFLLYHPRDHVRHTHTKMPLVPTIGINTTWVEFPLTGCTGSGASWSCPSGAATPNPGFLRTTPEAQWAWKEQTNATSRIVYLSGTSATFATRGCSKAGCADIITTKHVWSSRPGARKDPIKSYLTVTSTLQVGIGIKDPDTQIAAGWANGLDPETKCHRTARHYVEEIGGVENWLAAAYAAAGGKP